MTVSITAKSRTITNGTANDGSVVEAIQTELYNNDEALKTGVNTVIGTDSVKSGVDGKFLVVRNTYAGTPSSGEHCGLEVERGASTNMQIRWNETDDRWECTTDGTNYAPVSYVPVNAQTGTTYTVLTTDREKLITHTNASATTQTLPQATTSGFGVGFRYAVVNLGAGAVTITPTTSTINGSATLVLATNEGATIISDGTNYLAVTGGGGNIFAVTAKSALYTAGASDNNAFHTQTGTYTITLTAAATLGAKWNLRIKNIGTGNITIDGNGSETINGATTIVAGPGSDFLLVCDGSNFITSGRLVYVSSNQTLTADGTLTLAHGLGIQPTHIQLILKCTSSDSGYTTGDEVVLNNHINSDGATAARGTSVYFNDATNIKIKFPDSVAYQLVNLSTGTPGGVDDTKWALIVKAVA